MIALLFVSAFAEEQVDAHLVLRVDRPLVVVDAVVAEAARRGGWFSQRTDTEVTVRIPVAQAEEAVAVLCKLGRVADRGLQRVDLTERVADVAARLQSREVALARYEAVLAEAGPRSVVAVHRQILGVIEEMERWKGQLRVLRDRSEFATLRVMTQFEDRRPPVRDGTSSFVWVDSLDLSGLLSDFQSGWATWQSGVDVPVPDGFSAWRRPGRFRAASPDGVVMRVRAFRRQPEADLAFWTETLQNHLVASGYTLLSQGTVEVGGVSGVRVDAEAPCGTGDCAWHLVAVPKGRTIVVFEVGGTIDGVAARLPAVDQAITACRW